MLVRFFCFRFCPCPLGDITALPSERFVLDRWKSPPLTARPRGGATTHTTNFWNPLPFYCSQRRIEGDFGPPSGRRRILGFPTLRLLLRRREGGESPDLRSGVVEREPWGGAGVGGSLASSFWCSAAPPFRRRLRRCFRAAGESLSLRRRRWVRGVCIGAWWRRIKMVEVRGCGVLVRDLRRWPQIWGSSCSGRLPGRFFFVGFRSSSMELVATAVRHRLRARSSSAPAAGVPGVWLLRRLRRWRDGMQGDLEVEDGGFLCCSWFLLFSFVACIPMCKAPFFL